MKKKAKVADESTATRIAKKSHPMANLTTNLLRPGALISNKMAELQAKYPAPYGPLEEPAKPTGSNEDFK